MTRTPDSAAIFSGGLDSTTLVYDMLSKGLTPHLLSFDYGQRHSKELLFAEATAHKLDLPFDVIDLTGLTHLISNSALTSRPQYVGADGEGNYIEVPEGHYAEDNMKKTVVPNRNMIMLSIAAGVAVNNGYECLATGVHSGDHFVYPDCRPEFISLAAATIMKGNEGFGSLGEYDPSRRFLIAPYLDDSKADIAYRAIELNVPFEDTWSCYKGGERHCGKCGTCVERLEAIDEATLRYTKDYLLTTKVGEPANTVKDKTEYEDAEYWRTVIKN